MPAFTLAHLLALLLGYAFGAIPFGLLLTRWAGLGDVRRIGSGNIGATNVLRTGRKGLAAAVLAADILKGAVPVLVSGALWSAPLAPLIAGAGAFLGHLFPVWLGFRGGKGVATYIGVLLALAWPVALLFCAVWLATAMLARYSSLAALVAAAVAPLALALTGQPFALTLLMTAMTVLLYIRHHENIRRLLRGEESKIGQKG